MAKQPYDSRENDGPVKNRYARLAVIREPYLAKARKCAELTIPSLLPPAGKQKPAEFKTPFQAVGARGVNNLANKLLMTLFPPNTPFLRLTVGQYELQNYLAAAASILAENAGLGPEEQEAFISAKISEVNQGLDRKLASIEQAAMRTFELQGNRPTDAEILKHLIVAGDVMRYSPRDKGEKTRLYKLSDYVVKRAPNGKALEMITKDSIVALTVEPEVRAACGIEVDVDSLDKTYDLYTHIVRSRDERGEFWAVKQELNGHVVPDSEGEYEIDDCPWLPLRWTKVDGEDYGRGHVEEYLGALISLEGLSEALLEGAAAASRMLVFVNQNATSGTKLKDVARAKNGAVVPGSAADVTFLHSDKYHDLRTPAEAIQKLTQDLNYAFLVTAAIQRDAERVTSTEIRLMAQELETALGGVYTTLGEEYQRPVALGLLAAMQRDGAMPELPPEIEPVIITGMEALGRNTEYTRLIEWLQFCSMLQDQQEVQIRQDTLGIMNRAAASIGLNTEGLQLPEEQVQAIKQQMQQAQQMQELIARLGPSALNAGAKVMTQQPQGEPQA